MTSISWQALGTKAVLAVADGAALAKARRQVEAELAAIDRTCSRFRPDAELVRVNSRSGMTTTVSELLFEALTTALAAATATDGLVDPTIGRTLRLAGYDRTFAVVRERDGTLRPSFVRDPGWEAVELDEERRTVRVPRGVELDLGATAKALAADRSARAAFTQTGAGVLVSLGGDVAIAGSPPPDGWAIRVADDNAAPLESSGPVVNVHAGGLATSGTTVRRWATAGGVLHHIVDPRTGRPASSYWRTATVTGASCIDANTASTAAIVLGEAALDWLDTSGLPARLVRYDGLIHCVAGWPAEAA
jgi:thiamine biosynthesis lipoprotein